MVMEHYEPWTHTPFEQWLMSEGVTIDREQVVWNIHDVETTPWERTGTKAAFLDLTTNIVEGSIVDNQGTIRYVVDGAQKWAHPQWVSGLKQLRG